MGYRPRPVRFREIVEIGDWKFKAYEILYEVESVNPALVEAAYRIAEEELDRHGDEQENYKVGYIGIHEGAGGNFVFVSWWVNGNELAHYVHFTQGGGPADLVPAKDSGIVACVWDLGVMWFERTAWVDEVISNPAGPDYEAYLARRMNETF